MRDDIILATIYCHEGDEGGTVQLSHLFTGDNEGEPATFSDIDAAIDWASEHAHTIEFIER